MKLLGISTSLFGFWEFLLGRVVSKRIRGGEISNCGPCSSFTSSMNYKTGGEIAVLGKITIVMVATKSVYWQANTLHRALRALSQP